MRLILSIDDSIQPDSQRRLDRLRAYELAKQKAANPDWCEGTVCRWEDKPTPMMLSVRSTKTGFSIRAWLVTS